MLSVTVNKTRCWWLWQWWRRWWWWCASAVEYMEVVKASIVCGDTNADTVNNYWARLGRFPRCVLLALSWNAKKTNENPSTDKLRRAINYLCIDHNSNSQRTKKYIAVMCYPRAGPCESEATSGGIPGSDTSITSKITWRIIGLLKDIVNSLKSNKIGCRLQSC